MSGYENQAGGAQAPVTDKPRTEGGSYPRQSQGRIAGTPPGKSRPLIADPDSTDAAIRAVATAAMEQDRANSVFNPDENPADVTLSATASGITSPARAHRAGTFKGTEVTYGARDKTKSGSNLVGGSLEEKSTGPTDISKSSGNANAVAYRD